MILAQLGMGLGLIRDCIRLIKRVGKTHQHINCYEDNQTGEQSAALAGGERSLRAANAAMLHQGAGGYLRTATAQRRLREDYFIAIVTPALKHLRREIARREAEAKQAQSDS